MERELQLARSVQSGLIPREMPRLPGYVVAARGSRALEVCGDLNELLPYAQQEGRSLPLSHRHVSGWRYQNRGTATDWQPDQRYPIPEPWRG